MTSANLNLTNYQMLTLESSRTMFFTDLFESWCYMSTQTTQFVKRDHTPQILPTGSSYDTGSYSVNQSKYCAAIIFSDIEGVLKIEQKHSNSNNWHVTDECLVKSNTSKRVVSELVLDEVQVRYEMQSQSPNTLELYTLLKRDR